MLVWPVECFAVTFALIWYAFECKLIRKIIAQQLDLHPVRIEQPDRDTSYLHKVHETKSKSRTQQTDLPQTGGLLRKLSPNR